MKNERVDTTMLDDIERITVRSVKQSGVFHHHQFYKNLVSMKQVEGSRNRLIEGYYDHKIRKNQFFTTLVDKRNLENLTFNV